MNSRLTISRMTSRGVKWSARGLVGKLVEAADQVSKISPHLCVRHRVRVEIDVAELRDHHVEDVRFAHLLDLGLELESTR